MNEQTINNQAGQVKANILRRVGSDDFGIAQTPDERDWQRMAVDKARALWDETIKAFEDAGRITWQEAEMLEALDMLHDAPRAVAWAIHNNTRTRVAGKVA